MALTALRALPSGCGFFDSSLRSCTRMPLLQPPLSPVSCLVHRVWCLTRVIFSWCQYASQRGDVHVAHAFSFFVCQEPDVHGAHIEELWKSYATGCPRGVHESLASWLELVGGRLPHWSKSLVTGHREASGLSPRSCPSHTLLVLVRSLLHLSSSLSHSLPLLPPVLRSCQVTQQSGDTHQPVFDS